MTRYLNNRTVQVCPPSRPPSPSLLLSPSLPLSLALAGSLARARALSALHRPLALPLHLIMPCRSLILALSVPGLSVTWLCQDAVNVRPRANSTASEAEFWE
eukprot:2869675-Rhodomonas_salina.1